MSTLEINKIVAAVLTVGVVAAFSAFLASVIMHPHELHEPVYVVAGAAEGEETAETEVVPADDIAAMMAAAEAAAGEAVAKKCTACHTFEQGGPNKVGPNLWNVLDRPIASVEDFAYSEALLELSEEFWTYENLNAFVKKPKDFAPGTKMTFAGVKKTDDRANLIMYLRSMSDSPAALPEASAAAPSDEQSAAAQPEGDAAGAAEEGASGAESAGESAGESGGGLGALLASADAAAGEKTTKKCKACHSFEQGGPNKIGPNLWNVVNRPIASVEDFKYSDALHELSGESWTYENLAAFVTKPKDFAPGTKMSFPGVKKEEDRANLILYLRSMSDSPAPLPE